MDISDHMKWIKNYDRLNTALISATTFSIPNPGEQGNSEEQKGITSES